VLGAVRRIEEHDVEWFERALRAQRLAGAHQGRLDDSTAILDPAVRDVWGLPVGRITYRSHPVDVACAHHWGPRLEAVLTEAGARSTAWLTSPGTPGTMAPEMQPISRHWMGTAMGADLASFRLRSVATVVGCR
jgi:hypothetical protein